MLSDHFSKSPNLFFENLKFIFRKDFGHRFSKSFPLEKSFIEMPFRKCTVVRFFYQYFF